MRPVAWTLHDLSGLQGSLEPEHCAYACALQAEIVGAGLVVVAGVQRDQWREVESDAAGHGVRVTSVDPVDGDPILPVDTMAVLDDGSHARSEVQGQAER